MHGVPKRIQSCPVHPGRGTRDRPQPLTHPTPFATMSRPSPANPTRPDPLTEATQNSDILGYTPPTLAIPSAEIGVEPTTAPKSRYNNSALHQGHLPQGVHGFRTLQGTPTTGTHRYGDPGQPTGHPRRERATLRRAPSGNAPDSAAQRTHRTPDKLPTSHYFAAVQRPAHKPYNNPRLHARTPHPRDPTPLTGPRQQAAHS